MNKPVRLVVVMDPIAKIKVAGDSTLAMLVAAQSRGWDLLYAEVSDIWIHEGQAMGKLRQLSVADDPKDWFSFGETSIEPLGETDVILMRKDPPFDMEFIHATYILQRAEEAGAVVVNRPQSLRDCNEKVFISWFPQCAPPSMVSRSMEQLRAFVDEHGKAILKPLDRMAGRSIFMTSTEDPNRNVTLETLTSDGSEFIMAQKYLPAAKIGDKRILMIDGQPVPFGLLRVPSGEDFRGNLSMGAVAKSSELTERDLWICNQVGPRLKEQGLLFVGIDVIGEFLTEINVTSPTGIRELNHLCNLDIAGDLMEAISTKLA